MCGQVHAKDPPPARAPAGISGDPPVASELAGPHPRDRSTRWGDAEIEVAADHLSIPRAIPFPARFLGEEALRFVAGPQSPSLHPYSFKRFGGARVVLPQPHGGTPARTGHPVAASVPNQFVGDTNVPEKCPSQGAHLVGGQAGGVPPLNGRCFITVRRGCSADNRGVVDRDDV